MNAQIQPTETAPRAPYAHLAPDWAHIFFSAVESAFDAILITDAQLDHPGPYIVYVNDAFTDMTGWSAEAIVGKSPRVLQGEKTDGDVLKRLRKALDRGEPFDARAVNYRRDGTPFELEWRTAPIRDAEGRTTHYIAVQRDVTAEQRLMGRLQRLADFDDLTATLNRRPAEQTLRSEIKRAERHGTPLSTIMLDLDHFKAINDTHGHPAADEVLKQLVRLISRRLRESDVMARWGGEEFLLVLPETDAAGAAQLAEATRAIIEDATFVYGIDVTISLGVTAYVNGDSVAAMIERADSALYEAKEGGRNRVRVG